MKELPDELTDAIVELCEALQAVAIALDNFVSMALGAMTELEPDAEPSDLVGLHPERTP